MDLKLLEALRWPHGWRGILEVTPLTIFRILRKKAQYYKKFFS